MRGSGRRGLVEMPVSLCELSVVFVFWCCCTSVSAIENKSKAVVFSYAASRPHVATLSHHYRAPPSPEPEHQQPPSDQQQSLGQGGQGGVINFEYNSRDRPKIHHEHATMSPGYGPSTMVYDDHRSVDYNYQPYSPPQPVYNNEANGHSSVPPDLGYQSTPVYYDDRPPDDSPNIPQNNHYQGPSTNGHNLPETYVPDYQNSQHSHEAGLNPETYYGDPNHRYSQPSNEVHPTIGLGQYPETYDSIRNHNHSQSPPSTGLNHSPAGYEGPNHRNPHPSSGSGNDGYPETYDSIRNHNHSQSPAGYEGPNHRNPHPSSGSGNDRYPETYDNSPNHPHSQPLPGAAYSQYPETYSGTPNHHRHPQLEGPITANYSPETYDSVPNRNFQPSHYERNVHYTTPEPTYLYDYTVDHGTPTTFPMIDHNATHPDGHQYSPDNFPDYEAPASPEFFDYSSHRPRGAKTFSPLPSSTTPIFYDESEYVSTTPILEFESVKQKLPSIADYPPPNPGYITKPFNWRKKVEKLTRRPFKIASEKISSAHLNDKVLQKPKFFAYSSDLLDELDDDGGQEVNQTKENEEGDHVDYEQKTDEPKTKEEEHVKGGGQEHHSAHKTTAGDKGDKGYTSGHKHEEEKKGHHLKEDHKGKYLDEKGKKGKKSEEGGHYGEHHKAEKGKKAAKYGESGEHKKGHSTKGEHNIHKVDEYMKKHEFYDEHHEGGDHEKFGGFMEAHARKKGGKKKKGHHNGGHHHKHKGKKGHHEKGHKLGHHKGHKDAKGYDGHFSKHKKYGKKGGSKKGKKWGYSKGSPPK